MRDMLKDIRAENNPEVLIRKGDMLSIILKYRPYLLFFVSALREFDGFHIKAVFSKNLCLPTFSCTNFKQGLSF